MRSMAIAMAIILAVPNLALADKKKTGNFINFGDIKGESTDKDHKDWIMAAPKHGTSTSGNKQHYLQYNLTNTMISGHSLSAHPQSAPHINIHPPTTTVRVK